VALTTNHLVVPRREWVETYLCLAFVPARHVTGKLYTVYQATNNCAGLWLLNSMFHRPFGWLSVKSRRIGGVKVK